MNWFGSMIFGTMNNELIWWQLQMNIVFILELPFINAFICTEPNCYCRLVSTKGWLQYSNQDDHTLLFDVGFLYDMALL